MRTSTGRRERSAPLPGTAKLRLETRDPVTEQKVIDVLKAYFTLTEPEHYSGGRAYLQLDTRVAPPDAPEAD